jgi:hypothetical protein
MNCDQLLKRVKVLGHLRGPDTVYVEWIQVPPELQRRGLGTQAYECWEKKLPREVRFVTLHAVDGSEPFWESLGFEFRYDYGYMPDPTSREYEHAHYMIKGIRGAQTPPPIPVDDDEEEEDED